MSNQSLMSILQFGYAPMSSYELNFLMDDQDIRYELRNTVLYIIASRPLIRIENIRIINRTISFYLARDDVQNKLECEFYPEYHDFLQNRELELQWGRHNDDPTQVHGLKIYDAETKEFLLWFNPEKFLYLTSQKKLASKISGNILDFMTFDVLYVGKCTDEPIYKRFKSHHALQKILIQEKIIRHDYDKAHELVILPFEFKDNAFVTAYDFTNIEDIFEDQEKVKRITTKTIALDEEKALIKCLDPKYNREKFKSYPKSTDGLFSEKLGTITYSFAENIRLRYNNGSLIGNVNPYDKSVSFIGIQNGVAEIYNYEQL